MKFDEAIKYAYDEEVANVDISMGKADEMWACIEKQAEAKKSKFSTKTIYKIKSFIINAKYVGILEAAIFILILFFIPVAVKHFKTPEIAKPSNTISTPAAAEKETPINNNNNNNNNIDKNALSASEFADIASVINKGYTVLLSDEVYNIDKLDKFIANYKNGIKGSLYIVAYAKQDNKTWVNKLTKLESDGTSIKLTGFDPYSVKDYLIPDKPAEIATITKTVKDGGTRYAFHDRKDEPDNMGGTLISYNNNKVKTSYQPK